MLLSAAKGDRRSRQQAIETIAGWWMPDFDPDVRDGRDPWGTDPEDLADRRWHASKVDGFLAKLRDPRASGLTHLAVASRLPA